MVPQWKRSHNMHVLVTGVIKPKQFFPIKMHPLTRRSIVLFMWSESALYVRALIMYIPGRETEPHYHGREKGLGQNQRRRAARRMTSRSLPARPAAPNGWFSGTSTVIFSLLFSNTAKSRCFSWAPPPRPGDLPPLPRPIPWLRSSGLRTPTSTSPITTIPRPTDVSAEALTILKHLLGKQGAHEILSHPFLRLNFMTVRSRGLTCSSEKQTCLLGLSLAVGCNFIHRRLLGWFFPAGTFL